MNSACSPACCENSQTSDLHKEIKLTSNQQSVAIHTAIISSGIPYGTKLETNALIQDMSGLSYFQTDRVPGDIQIWRTLSTSITELRRAYANLLDDYKSSLPGTEQDKTAERLRNARVAICFFRDMLCAISGILRVATGTQLTPTRDTLFEILFASKAYMPDDIPYAVDEDYLNHSAVIRSIRIVAMMMANALEYGEILSFKLPRLQRRYGPGTYLTAKQHRQGLVNEERHQTAFAADMERMETARYNIVVHDQLVMKDEIEDLKDAQARESLSIGLKNLTRAANILIRVAREIERPNN